MLPVPPPSLIVQSENRSAPRARRTHASYLSVIARIIGFCLVYKADNRSGNSISSAALKSHQPPVRPSCSLPNPGQRAGDGPGAILEEGGGQEEEGGRREEGDICLQIKVVMNDILGCNGG